MERIYIGYYEQERRDFLRRHGEYREWTTLQDGVRRCVFSFADGAQWFEVETEEEEYAEVKPRGMDSACLARVTLRKIEFWTTENSFSRLAIYPA